MCSYLGVAPDATIVALCQSLLQMDNSLLKPEMALVMQGQRYLCVKRSIAAGCAAQEAELSYFLDPRIIDGYWEQGWSNRQEPEMKAAGIHDPSWRG